MWKNVEFCSNFYDHDTVWSSLGQSKYLSPKALYSINNWSEEFYIFTYYELYGLFAPLKNTAQKTAVWSHLLKKTLMENVIFCSVANT